MNEQLPARPDDPWDEGQPRPQTGPAEFAPTEQFPTRDYGRPPEPYRGPQYPPQQFADPRYPAPQFRQPEPLAHEGGLAYGNAPAAPYGPMDQFVPQHLHVPPYAQGANPYAQGPYPFGYPPQPMQQTVWVNNNSGRRVNHVLHLVLTLLTAGLWLPVWIILAIANS